MLYHYFQFGTDKIDIHCTCMTCTYGKTWKKIRVGRVAFSDSLSKDRTRCLKEHGRLKEQLRCMYMYVGNSKFLIYREGAQKIIPNHLNQPYAVVDNVSARINMYMYACMYMYMYI